VRVLGEKRPATQKGVKAQGLGRPNWCARYNYARRGALSEPGEGKTSETSLGLRGSAKHSRKQKGRVEGATRCLTAPADKSDLQSSIAEGRDRGIRLTSSSLQRELSRGA